MIHQQNSKVVTLITPQSVATNGTASGTVNVVGFDYGVITLQLGTAVASNVDATVAVTEGDVASKLATHADFTLATVAPNTSSGNIMRWYLDLRKRKKFLKLQYNPNTNVARTAAATIELSRAEQAPITTTGRGVDAQVIS